MAIDVTNIFEYRILRVPELNKHMQVSYKDKGNFNKKIKLRYKQDKN